MTTGVNSITNMQNEDVTKFLYEKTILCPVCGKESKNLAVKKSSFKVENRDTDSMVYYSGVNPSFYEVSYCTECGYAALPVYFPNLSEKAIRAIKTNISSKWSKPSYPDYFTVEFAIKQLKLALHNAIIKESLDSEKGLICIKLSWHYRLIGDIENEKRFQEQTIACFENAYQREKFPAAGMDEYSIQYLIGELYRRLGNFDKALSYYSAVIIANEAPSKLKEKVRDMKDLLPNSK
jgi:uncharacterized protein